MNEFEIRRRLAEARRKAEKELDYDDDGTVTAADFLRTKGGRRALVIAAVVVVVLLAIAFGDNAKAEEKMVQIPMDCGEAVCVVPKAILMALIKGHNDTVDENRRLQAGKPAKVRVCPGEKEG